MKVHIPSPLRSYTNGAATVEGEGPTVGAILKDLDQRYPGIRFRMIDEQDRLRPHIRVFINREETKDLHAVVGAGDEVQILQALSGG